MKRLILAVAALCALTGLWACEDGNGVDVNDPAAVCSDLLTRCPDMLYDGSQAKCEADVSSMDTCRLECAVATTDCTIMDQCLGWQVGYDGEVDKYCGDGAADGDDPDGDSPDGDTPDGDAPADGDSGEYLAVCLNMCGMFDTCLDDADWTADNDAECKSLCNTGEWNANDEAYFEACGNLTSDCAAWIACTDDFFE